MTAVAVVGGGAAGLAAAWSAARAGARVTLHECHDRVGGTTALSGGNAWLPGNEHALHDTAEEGLAYLRLGIARSMKAQQEANQQRVVGAETIIPPDAIRVVR